MNRVKVWVYALVVLVAVVADVLFLSRWLTERALAQANCELLAAAGQVEVRLQSLAAEASSLAELVAHDPAFTQAVLPDSGRDSAVAAQAAVQSGRRASGGDAAGPALVAVSTRAGVAARAAGAPVHLEADAASIVGNAVEARRAGYAFAADALWYLAAVPAQGGNAAPAAAGGAAAAVGLPLDATWLAALRASTGCGATLAVDGRDARTTLSAADLAVVTGAAKGAMGRSVSAGTLPAQPATFSSPVPLPSLSVPFAHAPAFRVRAVPLPGVPGASVVLSAATAPLLAPVASYLWIALAVTALLFGLGLLTGLAVTNEQRAVIPKDLAAAANRIARGDFNARAPPLAGSLGTISAALNRAAESAAARPPASSAQPAPARAEEPALRSVPPVEATAPAADPFARATPSSTTQELSFASEQRLDEVTAVVRPLPAPVTAATPPGEARPLASEANEGASRDDAAPPPEALPESDRAAPVSAAEPFGALLGATSGENGLLRATPDPFGGAPQAESGTEDSLSPAHLAAPGAPCGIRWLVPPSRRRRSARLRRARSRRALRLPSTPSPRALRRTSVPAPVPAPAPGAGTQVPPAGAAVVSSRGRGPLARRL